MPDTPSLALDNLAGTDPAGYAGLEDGVDRHWDRLLAGSALATLLGAGAELDAPENRRGGNRIVIAGRDGLQDSVSYESVATTKEKKVTRVGAFSCRALNAKRLQSRGIKLRALYRQS